MENLENKDKENNQIEIISGNTKDLDISKVYDHLNVEEPTEAIPDKENIVIPPSNNK